MIIGQVNRQVAYGNGKRSVNIINASSNLTAAINALNRAKESGDPKTIAEATKRVNEATQALKKVAQGKELSILKQKN